MVSKTDSIKEGLAQESEDFKSNQKMKVQ